MKKYILNIISILIFTIKVIAQSDSLQLKNNLIFPIEVFGKNGTIESVDFNINDPSNLTNIAGLRVKIHGLTYTNKASISVNNSRWYDLNNSNVVFLNKYEQIYQGMGNTYFYGPVSTFNLLVSIPYTNFYVTNTIRFRFNDLNGLTIGYRVLDMGVVKSNYTDLILHTKKIQDDPSKWKPYSYNAANINNGSNKWYSGTITHNGVAIRAKCNDCHVDGGYDLKYFNYSNKSIVLRSTALHSLSLQDAQDIASFIRTRNIPYEEKGRPWNPPYQPGPGMDSKPVRSWAAGAGLEWVLMNDNDMLTNIYPAGILTNLVNYGTNGLQAFNPLLTLNPREIPQIIPFPDWNRWLPHIHPLDAWKNWSPNSSPPTFDGSGYNYFPSTNTGILGLYQYYYNRFKNLTDKTQVPQLLDAYYNDSGYAWIQLASSQGLPDLWPTAWNTNGWGPVNSKILAEYRFRGLANAKYMNVKAFELMKTFEYEELGDLKGYWSDKRRWFNLSRGVFFTAPHTTKLPDNISEIRGMTPWSAWGAESTAWYQMAMVLNTDNGRNMIDQTPMDQGYFTAFGFQLFYPYKLSPLLPGGISGNGWTNRPLGIIMLNIIKAMEFTEKGATNVPNGYWGVNGIIGYYPGYSVAQAYNGLFDANQTPPNTDKTVLTFLINTYVQKYCDMVARFTAAQYDFATGGGSIGKEIYNRLNTWETWCRNLRDNQQMDLNATITKIINTRNTMFPTPP